MRVAAIDAAPAKVIGEPGCFGAFNQGLQLLEMLAIRTVSRAEVHGNAVLDDAVLFEDFLKHFQWPSAIAHEIFRDDLEPVDHRLLCQDVSVVWHTEANADAVLSEVVEG